MISLNGQPNGAAPPGTGTFTLVGEGKTFAVAFGMDDQLTKFAATLEAQKKRDGWLTYKVDSTDVEITYAIDGADQAVRSGNVVAVCKVSMTISGTLKNGAPITSGPFHNIVQTNVQFHNGNVEKMVLKK